MGKKKICWITGGAFMDTDQNVVPYLMKYSGMQIDWYQLSDFNSKVPLILMLLVFLSLRIED